MRSQAASIAYGGRRHLRLLQAPSDTVAGSITYCYRTQHIAILLQAARHEEGMQQRIAQREANIKVSKYVSK